MDISPDDPSFPDVKGTEVFPLAGGIAQGIGVHGDLLSRVFFQVEALFFLEIVVFLQHVREGGREPDRLFGQRLLLYLPAQGGQIGHPAVICVGFDRLFAPVPEEMTRQKDHGRRCRGQEQDHADGPPSQYAHTLHHAHHLTKSYGTGAMDMPLVRLDKLITDTGLCSRSQARDLIRRGRAAVDGASVTDPAAKFDPQAIVLTVDGKPLAGQEHIYVMLNKRAGVLTAARDPRKPTVLDDMPVAWKRRGIFPVGRLDKDTTGLLLLTDDGAFAHRVISPKSHVSKLYEAEVDGAPTAEDAAAFREGIVLKDGTRCLPAELQDLGGGVVRVEVFEGKYHQVKRMLGSRQLPVRALRRLRIGGLWLDENLSPGGFRLLTRDELQQIGDDLLSK